jgi:hypothetical protein
MECQFQYVQEGGTYSYDENFISKVLYMFVVVSTSEKYAFYIKIFPTSWFIYTYCSNFYIHVLSFRI